MVIGPLKGRETIKEMFKIEFARARMQCIEENLFEDGEWVILEWRYPLGLRGRGFFHVQDGQIVFQGGYFDQLSFFKSSGPPDSPKLFGYLSFRPFRYA